MQLRKKNLYFHVDLGKREHFLGTFSAFCDLHRAICCSVGSKHPLPSRRGHQHARGHSWQTWILAHHSTVAISCYFLDSSPQSWNFIFSSAFFWCIPVHNLLILVFPFWQISSSYKQGMNSCFLVPSCMPFLSELPAKSLDLSAINLTELVNGMLSTALRGNGTRLGRSQLPALQCRRKGTNSVRRRSCKHALSGSRIASRSTLPSHIYNTDGCLPQRT